MRKREKKWFDNYMKEYGLKKFGDEKSDKERKDMVITREYPGMYYLHIPFSKSIGKKAYSKIYCFNRSWNKNISCFL